MKDSLKSQKVSEVYCSAFSELKSRVHLKYKVLFFPLREFQKTQFSSRTKLSD